MHSRAPVRTLDFDSIGELGICFAVSLDKPCCVWGSYFHEGTAVPLRAAVEAGEVHVDDAHHRGRCCESHLFTNAA